MREGLYTNTPGVNHSYDKAKFAESYGKILEQYFQYLKLKKILDLNAESKVLEFGTGAGREAQHIRGLTQAQVLEADVSLAAYQASPNSERHFVVASTELPYPDNYFSFVHSKDAFVHIKDKALLLAEFRRVLKPNGVLCLTTELEEGIVGDIRLGMISVLKSLDDSLVDYFHTNEETLNNIINEVGFRLEAKSYWSPNKNEKNWYNKKRVSLLLVSTKK